MNIKIDRALADRFKLYADVTGMSIREAIAYALDDWMTTCGEGDIEVLTRCPMPMPADSLEAVEHSVHFGLLN